MNLKNKLLFAFLLLLFTLSSSSAITITNKAPIHINAAGLSHNRETGINIFSGPVTITQGTTRRLDAATVMTKQTAKGELGEITALGDAQKQAHFSDTSHLGKGKTMHAYANTIIYALDKEQVTLKGNAFLQQGPNEFKGNLIYYNMRDQTITSPKTPNSRTTIIYQPT